MIDPIRAEDISLRQKNISEDYRGCEQHSWQVTSMDIRSNGCCYAQLLTKTHFFQASMGFLPNLDKKQVSTNTKDKI